MTDRTTPTEAWQRGPVPGVDPLLMPVAHAFLQVQDDLKSIAARVPAAHVWIRPGGAASIAFHLRHIAGSTDRLLTYARGESLTDHQRAALDAETRGDPSLPLQRLVEEAVAALDRALVQVRATRPDSFLEERKVGRAGLPSTTLGLLSHAAEHATRHAGQATTTARILAGFLN